MIATCLLELVKTKDVKKFMVDLKNFNIYSKQEKFTPIESYKCYNLRWLNNSSSPLPSDYDRTENLEERGLLISSYNVEADSIFFGSYGSEARIKALKLFLLEDKRFLLAEYNIREFQHGDEGSQASSVWAKESFLSNKLYINIESYNKEKRIEDFLQKIINM